MRFVRVRLCPSRLSKVTRIPVFGVWSNGLNQAALTLFTRAGAAKGPLVRFPGKPGILRCCIFIAVKFDTEWF
jgi:hypothetical protein